MDVLDRSPQLGFFPVSPPPANASPLDPATNTPPTGDFAQALALAPTEAPSTTTAVVVAPVVVEPLPTLLGDVPVAVEFDPTAVLTAYIQYRAPQLPAAEEVLSSSIVEIPSTTTTNLDEPPIPAEVIPPVVIQNVIPIGLSQGLTIESPIREVLTATSVVEGDSNFVAPTMSFIINTLPTPILVVPTRPAPQTTMPPPVVAQHVATQADDADEPPAATPLVAPSFIALTMPQPLPVLQATLPKVTPRSLPGVVSTTKPIGEATIPSAAPVEPVISSVLANESIAAAPTAMPNDAPIRVTSTINTAERVTPATLSVPVSAEFQPVKPTIPTPSSLHMEPVETPVPRDTASMATQPLQVTDKHRAIPDANPIPRGESASLAQPIVSANSTSVTPSVAPQPVASAHSAPPQAPQPDEKTSVEAAAKTNIIPPNAFSAVTPVSLAPSAATSVAPPGPTVSRTIGTPADAPPPAPPLVVDTRVPAAEVVDDPTPVTAATATESNTISVATTQTDRDAAGKVSEPKVATAHDSKTSSTPKHTNDNGTLKPQSEVKATELKPAREDSRTEPVVPTAARHVEPVMATAPALDFGDPVPMHETRQVVQRLGDAIRLAHETGQHLSIRVTPPQFGPIVVHVQMHDGMVSARVETHSAIAQQVLTENLSQLHESLSARGAIIDRIDVMPVENRGSERSVRVEEVAPESAANGWMSSETPGRQGYDPQDSSRRRPPRPQPIKPATEAAAIEPVASTRPVQLQELNVRV